MIVSQKKLIRMYEHYFNEGAISGIRMALAILKDPLGDKEFRMRKLERIYEQQENEDR